jgi:phage/plasmid-associated DNA primase
MFKMLSGGDRLSGRQKFRNDTFDYFSKALVVITSNHELISSYRSEAISRRLCLFHAERVVPVEQQKTLIQFGHHGALNFQGPLIAELKDIVRWVFQISLHEAVDFINHYAYDKNPEILTDHLKVFCNHFLEFKQGARTIVGYAKALKKEEISSEKKRDEAKRKIAHSITKGVY